MAERARREREDSNLPPCRALWSITAIAHHHLGDYEAARAAFATATADTEGWLEDYSHYDPLGHAARELIEPTLSREEQLVGDLQQSRLQEAMRVVTAFKYYDSSGLPPGHTMDDLRAAYGTRDELLGPCAPDTIAALGLLAVWVFDDDPAEGIRLAKTAVEIADATTATLPILEGLVGAGNLLVLGLEFEDARRAFRLAADSLAVVRAAQSEVPSRLHLLGPAGMRWETDQAQARLEELSGPALEAWVLREVPGRWFDTIIGFSPGPQSLEFARGVAERAISMEAESIAAHALLALAHLRLGDSGAALSAISRAIELRAERGDDPLSQANEEALNPSYQAILAMAHYRLGGDEHEQEARRQIEHLRAIWSDPVQAAWWRDSVAAQSLSAEAEALVGRP